MSGLLKPMRYLIGADIIPEVTAAVITEVPWDCDNLPMRGETFAYCNLLDEKYPEGSRKYAPYLKQTGTAKDWNEGLIDPEGGGFMLNMIDQFKRRRHSGFEYAELDNADSYPLAPVLSVIDHAVNFGLKVICKNPGLGCSDGDADRVVAHPNVCGIIVERGAGTPMSMDAMRNANGKADMPVWFVNEGERAHRNAEHQKMAADHYKNMWVSWSSKPGYQTAFLL